MAGTPKEFRRVRGREGPKSKEGAPSVQHARRETRLRSTGVEDQVRAILSLRCKSTQEEYLYTSK